MDTNTRDLSRFGYRELDLAAKLLTRASDGPHAYATEDDDCLGEGMAVEFNPNSGEVFLTDEDCNVLMLNDDGKLERFVSCAECGHETFISQLNESMRPVGDDVPTCDACLAKYNS